MAGSHQATTSFVLPVKCLVHMTYRYCIRVSKSNDCDKYAAHVVAHLRALAETFISAHPSTYRTQFANKCHAAKSAKACPQAPLQGLLAERHSLGQHPQAAIPRDFGEPFGSSDALHSFWTLARAARCWSVNKTWGPSSTRRLGCRSPDNSLRARGTG